MSELHVFQPVDAGDLETGPYKFVGDKVLITSGDGSKVNTTAAKWGGAGYIWNKRVIFIYVRKNRYTREMIDASKQFSVSFLDQEEFRGALKYLEAVSGRDEDKVKNARLNINYDEGIPFIDEAGEVITCDVIYRGDFVPEGFLEESIRNEFYKDDNYHLFYIGEVRRILLR